MGLMTSQDNTNSLYSLSIQIHLDGLSFFTQNSHSKEVIATQTIKFTNNVNPTSLSNEVEKAFKNNEILSQNFAKVIVVYSNELFTMVPKALFDAEKGADYLKFNTKILSTDHISHDVIDFYDLVNVYVPYTSVNNFLFETFGSFDYYHSTTVFTKFLLNKFVNSTEPKILINFQDSYFEMGVVANKKLLFVNRFEIRTKEDFIYYMLFTMEQLELSTETIEVVLTGTITKDDPYYELAHTYVRHLSVLEAVHTQIPQDQAILGSLL